jgi:hypothetical protein
MSVWTCHVGASVPVVAGRAPTEPLLPAHFQPIEKSLGGRALGTTLRIDNAVLWSQFARVEREVDRDVPRALLGLRLSAALEAGLSAGLPYVEPGASSVGQQVDASPTAESLSRHEGFASS